MDILNLQDLLIAINNDKNIELTQKIKKSIEYYIELNDLSDLNIETSNITNIICQYYNLPEQLLSVKTRKAEVVLARQIAWYLFKEYNIKKTLLSFGELFGLSHSDVVHGINRIKKLVEVDKIIINDINTIKRLIERSINEK